MIKKIAAVATIAAAVGGVFMGAAPAQAAYGGNSNTNNSSQVLPIQLCDIPVNVIGLSHDLNGLLSSQDTFNETHTCVNGQVSGQS